MDRPSGSARASSPWTGIRQSKLALPNSAATLKATTNEFLYISLHFRGAELKMKMTAPVTSFVEPGSGPFSEAIVTVSLYLPLEQQSDPPRPSESGVFIEERAGMTVFVRSFDGFSSAQKNQEQLLTLASILREEGKVFDEKVYYTASYNSPFKLLDRNNEVWLIQRHKASKESE
ncbi:heme-binding protein 2 isoform X2 [Ochotona princeps]|uniref:heme-binding protein 2 isoform X2 n=1 Tax=Ochotona princeps TaxID=9978 RepID=UPI0027152E4B|nr:heme-binding protein 2 isoform X2 [Ochotona princeps]